MTKPVGIQNTDKIIYLTGQKQVIYESDICKEAELMHILPQINKKESAELHLARYLFSSVLYGLSFQISP